MEDKMEQTWNTPWNRNEFQNGTDMNIQNGTEMGYTMQQQWNTQWNRNEYTRWNRNGIQNCSRHGHTQWNLNVIHNPT